MTDGIKIENNQRIYHDELTGMANLGRRSVKTGCEVTQNTVPDMNVKISTGTVWFGETQVAVTGTTVAIAAADPSNDRMDLVVVNSSGVVSVIDGSATKSPTDPRPPVFDIDTYVLLARVYVEDGVTSIVDAKIYDLRTFSAATSGVRSAVFVISGMLSVTTNATSSLIANNAGTISSIYARVRNASVGAGIRFDVKKNGSSILTSGTSYIEIPAGSYTATRTTDFDDAIAADDYFDVEITQVGAEGTEGDDLTVVIRG